MNESQEEREAIRRIDGCLTFIFGCVIIIIVGDCVGIYCI